jgi:hypothetical protein
MDVTGREFVKQASLGAAAAPLVGRARPGTPSGDVVADTRANIEYGRKTFKTSTASPPGRPT